jgi:hypothetical protein
VIEKKIDKDEECMWDCLEAHWNQLKEVWAQEENIERFAQMSNIQGV